MQNLEGINLKRRPLPRLDNSSEAGMKYSTLAERSEGKTKDTIAGKRKTSKTMKRMDEKVHSNDKLYPDLTDHMEEGDKMDVDCKDEEHNVDEGDYSTHETSSPLPDKTDYKEGYVKKMYNIIKNPYISFGILIIIVVFFALCIFRMNRNTESPVSLWMESLKRQFKSQRNESFIFLSLALEEVVDNAKPTAPAVIMMPFAEGGEETVVSITKSIIERFAENHTIIKGADLKNSIPAKAKKEIDEKIKENFDPSKLNALIVHDLQYVHGKAAMIFHSYCDHENARFKKAIFIMTISCQKEIPEDYVLWNLFVDECLDKIWEDHEDEDQRLSLINRINMHTVPVFPES